MELGIVWPPTWLELARAGSNWLEFVQAQIFAQLEPSLQLRWSWVSFGHPLGLSWLELDRIGLNLFKLKFSPNSSQVFHHLATSANSRQSVLLLLGDCLVVVRQSNGFLQAGSTWRYCLCPPADAKFDLVTWLELAWEYRLVREIVSSLIAWHRCCANRGDSSGAGSCPATFTLQPSHYPRLRQKQMNFLLHYGACTRGEILSRLSPSYFAMVANADQRK